MQYFEGLMMKDNDDDSAGIPWNVVLQLGVHHYVHMGSNDQ